MNTNVFVPIIFFKKSLAVEKGIRKLTEHPYWVGKTVMLPYYTGDYWERNKNYSKILKKYNGNVMLFSNIGVLKMAKRINNRSSTEDIKIYNTEIEGIDSDILSEFREGDLEFDELFNIVQDERKYGIVDVKSISIRDCKNNHSVVVHENGTITLQGLDEDFEKFNRIINIIVRAYV